MMQHSVQNDCSPCLIRFCKSWRGVCCPSKTRDTDKGGLKWVWHGVCAQPGRSLQDVLCCGLTDTSGCLSGGSTGPPSSWWDVHIPKAGQLPGLRRRCNSSNSSSAIIPFIAIKCYRATIYFNGISDLGLSPCISLQNWCILHKHTKPSSANCCCSDPQIHFSACAGGWALTRPCCAP